MSNIYKWIRKNKLLFLIIVLLSIFVIFLPSIILTESSIGVINNKDSQTVLNYFGTIIGGLFTLVGVLITIKFESKKDIKRLSVEYKPILEIKQESPRIEIEENITKLIFTIRNIGRGEALYVKPSVINTKYIHCIDGISMNVSDKSNNNDYYNLVMTYETKYERKIKKELGNKMNILIKYTDLTESKVLSSLHIIEFSKMFSKVDKVYN